MMSETVSSTLDWIETARKIKNLECLHSRHPEDSEIEKNLEKAKKAFRDLDLERQERRMNG